MSALEATLSGMIHGQIEAAETAVDGFHFQPAHDVAALNCVPIILKLSTHCVSFAAVACSRCWPALQ